MSSRSPIRRWATRLLALTTLATTLVAVPLPTIAFADTFAASVRSEPVRLAVRAAGRVAPQVLADAAELPELQGALARPGRRAARATTAVDAVGVTLPTPPTGPLLVRGLVDGTWTPWSEVAFEPDEGPDGVHPAGTAVHSEPVWLGHATAYELDGPADVATATVHLVTDQRTGRSRQLVAPAAGAAGAPSILTRAAWGARPPKATPSISADLRLAVVHHSVTPTIYSADQVPAMLRSIQAYHQDVQGWDDIAYNFGVDRFGRIWEGRAGGIGKAVLGGHARGFNTASVGVVVLGDFTSARPTAAAIEGVSKVIAWKFALHRIDPASTTPFTTSGSDKYAAGTTVSLPRIVGHRDVQATSCPGAGLAGQLGTIRRRVAQLLPGYQAGVLPDLLAGDSSGDGLTDPFEVHPGPTAEATWRADGRGGFTHETVTVALAYRMATGDFDGDGRRDVLWHGTGSATDVIWWSDGRQSAFPGGGTFVPVIGDFDGDGRDDILWYAPGLNADQVWYSNAGHGHTTTAVSQDLITGRPVVGDFDGDGRDDVMWHGPGTASDGLWWSTGRGWRTQAVTVSLPYTVTAVRDDPDGRDELLFVAPPGASSVRWEIDGSRQITSHVLRVPGSNGTPSVADLDGDGHEDVFLYTTSGSSAIWYTGDTAVDARSLTLRKPYAIAAGRMVSADAAEDLLLVNPSGTDYLWRIGSGRTLTSTAVG